MPDYPHIADIEFAPAWSSPAQITFVHATRVERAGFGYEVRDALAPSERRLYDISCIAKDITSMQYLRDFFMARRGRAQGFRWEDSETGTERLVRFASDTLIIRPRSTEDWKVDCRIIELHPDETGPVSVSGFSYTPATIPGGAEVLPMDLVYNATVTISFDTHIHRTTDGFETRIPLRKNPDFGCEWNIQTIEEDYAFAFRDFFNGRAGQHLNFYVHVPNVIVERMVFGSDRITLTRKHKDSWGLNARARSESRGN